MLAPNALNSDKGHNISERARREGSSSEFSEDDTPLAVRRLNLQANSGPNISGKLRRRSSLTKKGGFVIPRKKKQGNELLQASSFDTREGKEILRNAVQSYRDPVVGATFKFEKLELVYNDQLSREFQDKKQSMRNEWRNARDLEDKHAFFYTADREEARKICETGLEVGSTPLSCLGDPSMGVYLSRHADVISRKPLVQGSVGYLIVFKVIKGKVKPVTERSAATTTDLLEPTPNFDCHVSRSIQNLPVNSPLNQVFEYSQYYFYEFAEEGDDLHVKRPRQCLPYAVITFTTGDTSGSYQEPSVVQEELPSVDNSGFLPPPKPLIRHETRIPEKRRGRGSHVVWMGKIKNKDRILADAQLVCHSVQKIKLPFEIGENIVMKEKISFQQLRPFLTFPLFHAGPPSVSGVCKASLAGGASFLHCDVVPIEDDHGKIKKLVKFFQEKNWAGIVKSPDASRVIFLIPTSQITLDLGLTTVDSPATLHVLLFVKKQKTGRGSLINKTTTSSSVREKDFGEVKTVNQIQKELKRQFSAKVDVKEKPFEKRRNSLDSARSGASSVSISKETPDIPDFLVQSSDKGLTNEQTVSWRLAVESWLSRPHPLGGAEGDFQKTTQSSSSLSAFVPKPRAPASGTSLDLPVRDVHVRLSGSNEQQKGAEGDFQKTTQSSSSVSAFVPKPRAPASGTSLDLPVRDVHVRSSGSNEQQKMFSGKQDANLRTSVNTKQHRVLSGQQNLAIRSTSTEQQKVVSGPQDVRTRYIGNTEQQRVALGQHADVLLRQLKEDHIAKKDSTPAVQPLVVRKEEHRQDPRLKMRRSLNEEPATRLMSSNAHNTSHGTPYNAQESLQAQGLKPKTTTVSSMTMTTSSTTTTSTQQSKYQVNSEILKEFVKLKAASVPSVTMTTSSTTPTNQQFKYQVNNEFLRDLIDKMKVQNPQESTSQSAMVDGIRRALDMLKNQEGPQTSKPESLDAKTVTKQERTGGKLGITSDEKSVKRSSSSVSSTQEKGKRFKMDQDNSVKENVPTVSAVLPTLSSGGRSMTSGSKKEEKQAPVTRSEEKETKASQAKEPKQHKDSPQSQAETANNKPVKQDAVPELSEAPPPAILSLDTLTSSQSSSDKLSKAPKLKLILKKRDSKDVSTELSSDDNSELSRLKLAKEPKETEHEGKADSQEDRKSLDSPVAMDLSPQCTTPTGSVSPITVVSSKGRYNSQVTPTTTPATAPTPPVPCAFPFNPPLPQGPYRGPITTGPCTSLPRPPTVQMPVHPVPFSPPFPPAPASGSSAPTVLQSPSVSSAPSTAPFCSPPPAGATFVPHSPITPVPVSSAPLVPPGPLPSSSSFPIPPPPRPPIQHHDQQWAAPLPHGQSFGFPMNMPPRHGIVPVSPPSEVRQWAANSSFSRPVLPPPGLPPVGGRPHHGLPQSAPFPVPVVEMPVVQPRGVGFPPMGVPRFNALPAPPTGPRLHPLGGVHPAPQMMPVHPLYGSMPSAHQFPPRQPTPIGFWRAPLLKAPVPSGKTKGRADFTLSQSTEQKYSKESTSSTSKKSEDPENDETRKDDKKDLCVAGVQKGDEDTKKENASESSEGEASVKTVGDVEKSSAETGDQTNAVTSKSEMTDSGSPKEDKGLTAENDVEKAAPNKENVFETEIIKEVVGDVNQTSTKAEEAGAKELEIPMLDQMSVVRPKKSPIQMSSTHDSTDSEENPKLSETEIKAFSDVDLTKPKDEDVVRNDFADDLPKKTGTEVEDPHPANVGESQILSSQHLTEPCDNFTDKHSDVSISGNSADFVDINSSFCLPTTTYQTEAERKGSKAVSKIYDILRRNAQESRTEAEEEVEEADDPEKPDTPDPSTVGDELNADEEGFTEEEKLLFSGEDSSPIKNANQLESGLRVVQLLDLGSCEKNDEQETVDEESSTLNDENELQDGQNQDEVLTNEPSHKEEEEALPKGESEWEDISDISDEGTPERDLPEYGSVGVGFKQIWPSEAVETTHRTVPASDYVPPQAAGEAIKPKEEVVRNEADSSSTVTDRHQALKSYVTVPAQKRKRWKSSSEDRDSTKLSSPRKRSKKRSHERRSRRESPGRHRTVDSSHRDRQVSDERYIQPKEHVSIVSDNRSRIVSDFRGLSLKITILQDPKSSDVEVREEELEELEEEEADFLETEEAEKKRPLTDIEYSDLEDISPGRLSSDVESPATPDTPETATPAMDFTHPSLGFWAAPLKSNEISKTAGAVSDEHQVSGSEMLSPPPHSSYPEEHPLSVVEQSQVPYFAFAEGKVHEDAVQEPCITRSSWPVKGFFCQTTTAEERDLELRALGETELVDQGVEKDSFLVDNNAGHYFSQSAHESGEDIARYSQEHPQSEVFDYGHGLTDHRQHDKSHRSSTHKQPRGIQKEVKHRTTIRETRYPWKSREESKHSQAPSAGGEGSKSASQSATGRNSGCDDESTKHVTKRAKVVQAAQSTSDAESGGVEKPSKWEIYIFARINKTQLENWVRRKNHGAKLATIGTDQKCTVQFTPESIRRSSERLYRRAKMRMRRLCQSSRSFTEDVNGPDCPDFEFDDMNAETTCGGCPCGDKEASCCSVSEEAPQSGTVKDDGTVERCTVHSTFFKHPASPCTMTSEVAQNDVDVNVDDCNDSVHSKTDDLLCDEEVSVILQKGLSTEVEEATSQVVDNEDDDVKDPDSNCSTPDSEGEHSSVKGEDLCDVSLEDQATVSGEDGVTRSPGTEAESDSNLEQDVATESPAAEMCDSNADEEQEPLNLEMQDNSRKDVNEDDKVVHDAASEEDDAAEEEQSNPKETADNNTVDEANVTGGVALDSNSQHDKSTSKKEGVKEDSRRLEKALVMPTKDTVTEDVKVNESTSCVEEVVRSTSIITDDQENRGDLTSVAGQSAPEGENAPCQEETIGDETAKCPDKDKTVEEKKQAEPEMATDKGGDRGAIIANSEPQTSEDHHMEKAPFTILAADEKTSGTAASVTNTLPIVTSVTVSSDQFTEANNTLQTAYASTFNEPVTFALTAQQMPLFTAVNTPMMPPLATRFPSVFPPLPPTTNFAWPVTTHAVPFTTAGIVPVLPPAQLQNSHGCNLSWANHTPHVPLPVGCMQPHAAFDGLRPPGTDDVVSEPTSSATTFPSVSVAQEHASKYTDDEQAHESVLDHSVVTALMQFYSEIKEEESSKNTDVEGIKDNTKTSCGDCIPEASKTAQNSRKEHKETSDMEIESLYESSDIRASDSMEVSGIDGGAILILDSSESSDKSNTIQDKPDEMGSSETSNKQSSSAVRISEPKEETTLVEKSVDVTEAKNPCVDEKLREDQDVFKNEHLKEIPGNASDERPETISGDTTNEPVVRTTDIAMDEPLLENPAVTLDQKVTDDPVITTERTKVHGDPSINMHRTTEENLVENPNSAAERTVVQKVDLVNAEDDMQVGRGSVASDGKVMRNEKENRDAAVSRAPLRNPDISSRKSEVERCALPMEGKGVPYPSGVMDGKYVKSHDVSIDEPLSEKPGNVEEDVEEEQPMSPIDPHFMASAEQAIVSSIGGLTNLLGQSSTFDRIAEETIASTVSSLEDILRQAHSSYLESSSCPSDSGVSVGEEASGPSRAFGNVPVSESPLQDDGCKTASLDGRSSWSSMSGGLPPEWPPTDIRTSERSETTGYIRRVAAKPFTQKRSLKPAGHRRFQFFVYSPEFDRECEAVKNYMLKAGGTFVDVKDSSCLEENARELKVLIRRKHLPSVHRLANLYQLKMSPFVKFSLFNTLTDVTEGSRLYENIFVSGGALLADDNILKTIELDHLDALLRYLKEQSVAHQKYVWVLNISRNGYKKLSLNKPLTRRDSQVLNLLREYKNEGFITVLQKGYVTENIPSTQRYLQTSLKLQIELMSVYRHVILLSDMDKKRMEVPWFFERGIGVMNVKEFLNTFAGEREATNLLLKRPNPDTSLKETLTVAYLSTPEDETSHQTPERTPMSDSSTDSPHMDIQAQELPRSAGTPRKRAVRSLSWDAGSMTHTRLQILSCVRSVRDNIRSQISNSTPSSPVGRSM